MPVTKKALVLLILVLTCSMFVAKISNIINVDINELKDLEGNPVVVDFNNSKSSTVIDQSAVLGKSEENLLWFVQVT